MNKMRYSKFCGINVLLACFGLSFLAACGGDKSSGPQLELSTEGIQTTYVLGSAPGTAQIALRNIGDEVLTFSLGGTAFWVSAANATSGEVVPGEKRSFNSPWNARSRETLRERSRSVETSAAMQALPRPCAAKPLRLRWC